MAASTPEPYDDWVPPHTTHKWHDYTNKIGVSHNPKRRLAQMNSHSPTPVTLLMQFQIDGVEAREVEQELHRQFRAYNVQGEWFNVCYSTIVLSLVELSENMGFSMRVVPVT